MRGLIFCMETYPRGRCNTNYSLEMYLTQDERKSVVAERYIRSLKNKIYKYMT